MTYNRFINCSTLSIFNTSLESGYITNSDLVFIEETKQIWTHGQFYSCPYTKEEIDNLIKSSGSNITKSDIEKVLIGNITSHTHNQYLTSYTETDPTVPAWAKAASKPSYSYSEITNTPTSLKNPTSITIQGNGSSLGSYDGSVAKTINLTYSNIGAAAAGHTHTKSQITDFPSTLPNANALTLKINSGTTEGTNLYTYTGSSVKSLNIKAGSNITLTASSGTLTISSSYTNTTYSAGTGLSLSGTTFSLGTSGVSAGSYGPTANVSGSNGTTINVPQITVDSYGRVTGVTNRVYTSVDTNTTYSLGSFGVTATAAQLNFCSGVTSNIQTQLNNKAASSHTHNYLPLSGGILTGDLTINNTKGFNIGWSTKVTKTSGVWIHGGADAASSTDANLRFGSWWGIGWYPTFSGGNVAHGNNAMWLDVRDGNLDTHGAITAHTNYLAANWDSARRLVMGGGDIYAWIDSRNSSNSVMNNIVLYDDRTEVTKQMRAPYFKSIAGTGTQPYQCSSTTLNTNLNADMLDGAHLAGIGGRGGVMRSWSRGAYTKVNQYFGNGNVVTIDPKPTDDATLSANTTILSLGDNANRNTQLAFYYEYDTIKYRRCIDSGWTSWATLLNSSNWTGYVTYIPRDRGSNTVSTLTNLPVTKSTIIANLSAATSISVASGMNVGESITVICNPTASFTQPIPTTGSYKSMDGSSLSVTSGKQFEINIYCYASNTYSISCKVAK